MSTNETVTEGLRFTLKRKEIPFEAETEDGTVESYVLREMNGAEREIYLNTLPGRVKTDVTGKVQGVSNFKGMNFDLLGKCVFKDGSDKPIDKKTIDSWPSTMQEKLVELCQGLNALNKKAEEEEKNE